MKHRSFAALVSTATLVLSLSGTGPAKAAPLKNCTPQTVVPGETVTCTISIPSLGEHNLTGFVTDNIPNALRAGLGTVTTTVGRCTTQNADPEISCTDVLFVAPAAITYTVVVPLDTPPGTTFTNTATFTTINGSFTDSETFATVSCTIDRRTASSPQNIVGTAGDDVICGSAFGDNITGMGGNDFIYGFSGDDRIVGGAGNDVIVGGDGNDYLVGDSGNDSLLGGAGTDLIAGGVGTDTCTGELEGTCEL